jgi:hypothetical protein
VLLPLFCASQNRDDLIDRQLFSVAHHKIEDNPKISREVVSFCTRSVSGGGIADVASGALYGLRFAEVTQYGSAPAAVRYAELFHSQQLQSCERIDFL